MKLTPEQEESADECGKVCRAAVDNMMTREGIPEKDQETVREGVLYMGEQFTNRLALVALAHGPNVARVEARAVVLFLGLAIDGMIAAIPALQGGTERHNDA